MTGCIDVHGYASSTGSWLLCGWAPVSANALPGRRHLTLRFERGVLEGEALVAGTVRDDLGTRGRGVVAHLPSSDQALGQLVSAEIDGEGGPVTLHATPGTVQAEGQSLVETLRAQRLSPPGIEAGLFRGILQRPAFEGRDTLDRFEDQFAFRIDEAIGCGASGLLLNGWLMTAPAGLRGMRLRSGSRSTPIDVRDGLRVARPDVVAKYGDALRSRNAGCGFVLHVPDCLEPGASPYLEIETVGGEVGFLRLLPSRLSGLGAIRNVLGSLSPRYDEVQRTFDAIGPALSLLNRDRLDAPRSSREIRFGTPPEMPLCSVIVPLYGRIDYMEVQVALLAQGTESQGTGSQGAGSQGGGSQGGFRTRHELIYVGDDPGGADAACALADSLFRRFGLPLRLLLLEENMGFAPACNAGLAAARGGHVCFLNSDVFATEPDWLDRLLDDFARHPSVGIIGPLLLFEDGTVQHQGMRYEALPEFSHWLFPTHPGKGSRPAPSRALSLHPAITGACMVMPRQRARDLHGCDESFVIGDFEDSDLCLRAREAGVASAVDHGVVLYHLERKSQASAAETWRMNVTLFNAWLHQGRWASKLAAEAEAPLRDRNPGPEAATPLPMAQVPRDAAWATQR